MHRASISAGGYALVAFADAAAVHASRRLGRPLRRLRLLLVERPQLGCRRRCSSDPGAGAVPYAQALAAAAPARDVAAVLRADDAPDNVLTVLRDVTAAWGAGRLSDAAVGVLLRELAVRQQRGPAASAAASVAAPAAPAAPAASGEAVKRKLSYSARELFERARAAGHPVAHDAYTQLLVCFANSGSAALAQTYFAEMKAAGVTPSVYTYTAVANCHALINNVLELRAIMDEMKGAEDAASADDEADPPSGMLAVHRVFLRSVADTGGVWETYQVAGRLAEEGYGVRDEEVAQSLLRAGGGATSLAQCIKTFVWMKDRGLVLTEAVYHSLLEQCLHARAGADAEGVVMVMKEEGMVPSAATLSKLLDVHAAAGEPTAIALALQRLPREDVSGRNLCVAAEGILGYARAAAAAAAAAQEEGAGGEEEKAAAVAAARLRLRLSSDVAQDLLHRYAGGAVAVAAGEGDAVARFAEVFCVAEDTQRAEVCVGRGKKACRHQALTTRAHTLTGSLVPHPPSRAYTQRPSHLPSRLSHKATERADLRFDGAAFLLVRHAWYLEAIFARGGDTYVLTRAFLLPHTPPLLTLLSFPEDRTATQHNTTQHNTTQHNTTQHNTTQHNTTQHNTTQRTGATKASKTTYKKSEEHQVQRRRMFVRARE